MGSIVQPRNNIDSYEQRDSKQVASSELNKNTKDHKKRSSTHYRIDPNERQSIYERLVGSFNPDDISINAMNRYYPIMSRTPISVTHSGQK